MMLPDFMVLSVVESSLPPLQPIDDYRRLRHHEERRRILSITYHGGRIA